MNSIARRGKHRARLHWVVVLLVAVVVSFCVLTTLQDKHGVNIGLPSFHPPALDLLDEFLSSSGGDNESSMDNALAVMGPLSGASLEVHILDMGQADSILIKAPGSNVLIDAGENNQGQQVLRYLKAQDVDKIDILIGTHPHADHIGGMDTVIEGIKIGKVILPTIPDEIVPATVTYTDLLLAIAEKRLGLIPAKPGAKYDLGKGATMTILAPQAEYADLNNMSVVTRLDFGKTSFLFTGDASAASEADMLDAGVDLDVDVLGVGHHGSDTSTTEKFLQAVSPRIATIACGVDNSYGHPHREVVQRLQERDVQIIRTDISGAIVIVSDGETLGVSTEK